MVYVAWRGGTSDIVRIDVDVVIHVVVVVALTVVDVVAMHAWLADWVVGTFANYPACSHIACDMSCLVET